MRATVASLTLAFALAPSSRAFAGEVLTVDQAVARALELSPQFRAAQARRDATVDQQHAVRGQLLPSVAVQEEFQHYDKAFAVEFAIPGAPVAPSFTARNQNTNTFTAVAKQPVLGLLKLSQDYSAASSNAEAADAQLVAAQTGLREQVETTFLRLFEARAALQVAQASESQLAEQVGLTNARIKAGSGTNADLLRTQVAKANIRQQALQAKVQESAARTQLLTMLDLPFDSSVDFAEPLSLEQAANEAVPTLSEATDRAYAERPELKVSALSAEAAEANSRARLFALLPDVDVEAAYVRIDGQAFAPPNSWFIGAKATFPVWLWGSQWYAHRAAAHQAEAARLLEHDSRRQVRVEVSGRLDQLEAATSAIEVATTAITSAEESYRVTTALVQAGSGTTTDLLDAQSALTQAKLNLVRAKYQQALARVQLRRAIGQ